MPEHEVVEHLVGRGRGRQDGEREDGRLDQAGSVKPARSRALVSAPPAARRKQHGRKPRSRRGPGRTPSARLGTRRRPEATVDARESPRALGTRVGLDLLERQPAARATSSRGGRPSSPEGSGRSATPRASSSVAAIRTEGASASRRWIARVTASGDASSGSPVSVAKARPQRRRPLHVRRDPDRFLLPEVAAGPEAAHGRKVVRRDGRERERAGSRRAARARTTARASRGSARRGGARARRARRFRDPRR